MSTEMIHARIDTNLKHEAEKVFRSLGINTADAIRMFLSQVTLRKGIPFDVRIPNKETRKAMEDLKLNRNLNRIPSDSLDDLFHD